MLTNRETRKQDIHIHFLSKYNFRSFSEQKIFFVPTKYLHWWSFFFPPDPSGQEVLLVTIPDFSSTQTACLVNLRTFDCEPVKFSAFSADDDEESEMNISH